MATTIFNPPLPEENPPNFLGYSKGRDPDLSSATLIKTAGHAIEQGVKASEEYFDTKTKEEARERLEPIRDAFLGMAEPPKGLVQDSNAPNDLVKRSERLTGLTRAMEAGTVPKSHYWMLMDSEVRQLKQRYPGHKDNIDRHVQSLVGTNPANRAVELLFAEARAGKEETQYQKAEKQLRDLGGGVPMEAAKQAGKPWSIGQIHGEIALIQRDKAESEIRRQGVADAKAKNELQIQDVRRLAQADLGRVIDKAIRDMQTGTGQTYASIQDEISRKVASGSYSPQDQEAIRVSFGQLRQQVLSVLTNERMKTNDQGFSWNEVVKAGDMDEIIKGEMKKLDLLEDALLNKDLGYQGANAAQIEATKKADVRTLLEHPQHGGIHRQFQALKELYGVNWTQLQVFQDSTKIDAVTKALKDNTILNSVTGSRPGHTLKTDLEEKSKLSGFSKSSYNNAIITDSLSILGNKNAPTQAIANKIDFLFSDGDLLLHKGKDGKLSPRFENPQGVYLKLATDPRVIENVAKIKDTNPEQYQKFRNFVLSNFAPMMELNSQAARNVVLHSDNHSLTFDPVNYQFRLDPKPGRDQIEPQVIRPAENSIRQINTTLAAIRPLIEAEKGDVKAELQKFVDTLQIDTNKTHRGSGLTNLWEGAMNMLQKGLGNAPSTGPESKEGSRPKDVAGLLDFVGKLEGGKEGYNSVFGGGRADLTKMTVSDVRKFQDDLVSKGSVSSAVGKYQIIRKTMGTLIRDMGFDPTQAKFTPELQDAMAVQLMKGRGLDKFMKGEITHEQFADELAKEWASLPNTKTGRSHYEGAPGSNKALTNSDEVRKVLEGLVPRKDLKIGPKAEMLRFEQASPRNVEEALVALQGFLDANNFSGVGNRESSNVEDRTGEDLDDRDEKGISNRLRGFIDSMRPITATNPTTGETIVYKNGTWVPFSK
jgi:muramidase (phage lysozyme)